MTESPATTPAPAGPRRAAVAFIFITVFLDMLSIGMIVPVLPTLVTSMTGGDASEAAFFMGLFATGWALMQFIFMPILGGLSDAYGRRPVVLASNAGMGIDYVFMALAPNLWFLFIGRLVSGMVSASFSTAFAYIADVTPGPERAKMFGLMGAAFGVGFIIGPAFGGLLGSVDMHLPFWVAAGLSLANFAYGYFILPESLPKEKRSPFTFAKANPVGSLRFLQDQPALLGLSAVFFLFALAHVVLPSLFSLYATTRYGWGPREVGLVLALVGLSSMLVQTLLVGRIVKALGERMAMLAGLTAAVVVFGIYGFAEAGWMVLVGIPIGGLTGLFGPAAQALMSRQVSETEQGRLQGAVGSIQSITGLIGPSLFAGSFAFFIGASAPFPLPGAPFFVACALSVAALVLALRVMPKPAQEGEGVPVRPSEAHTD